MSSKLVEILSAIRPISERFREAIQNEVMPMQIPKGHYLLQAPKVAVHIYFLESGFVMCYSFYKGKKQVESFWRSGQVILLSKSFFDRVPSEEFLQVAVSSEVLYISYAGMQRLFSKFADAHPIIRSLLHEQVAGWREQVNDLKHLSAGDRFEKLIATYPQIEQAISQEDIASYLHITPQSLSRIKRNKNSGNIR